MIDLFALIRSNLILLFVCLVAGAVAGVSIALTSTVKYQSSVVLFPTAAADDSGLLSGGLGALGSLGGLSLGGTSETEANIAFLSSRLMFQKLNQSLNIAPLLLESETESDAATGTAQQASDPISEDDAYRVFDRSIRSIKHDRRTGLVTLSVTWTDAEQARIWVTEMVRIANRFLRDAAILDTQKAIEFLNQEASKTTVVELQNSIYKLMEIEIKKSLLANVRDDFAFKTIDPAVTSSRKNKVAPKRGLIVVGFMFASVALYLVFITLFRSGPALQNVSDKD